MQVITISKMLQKEKEKYEENKTLPQIWNWRCSILRKLTQKKLCVSVKEVSSYRCVKMAFSLLLYMYTWLSRTLRFLGRMTHYRVTLSVVSNIEKNYLFCISHCDSLICKSRININFIEGKMKAQIIVNDSIYSILQWKF